MSVIGFPAKVQQSAKKAKKLHWQLLFDAMYPRLMQLYDNHNEKFTGSKYTKATPNRVKRNEKKTGVNILRLMCRKMAKDVANGHRVVTNMVPVNRASALGWDGAVSTAPGHFAKLAYAGALVAREADDDDAQVYQRWNRTPLKRWHGSCRDFDFLMNPDLLPVELLEAYGVDVLALEGFDEASEAEGSAPIIDMKEPEMTVWMSEDVARLLAQDSDNETANRQSLADISAIKETIEIRELENAVSLRDESLAEANGNTQKQEQHPEQAGEEAAAGGGGRRRSIFEEMRERRRRRMAGNGQDARQDSIHALALQGDSIRSDAKMLMDAYEKRLMRAMNKQFSQRVMDKGLLQAEKLVASVPDHRRTYMVSRWLQVISHMEEWILDDPVKNFVYVPYMWFDHTTNASIAGAEKRWLAKYEHRSQEFKDLQAMARYQDEEQAEHDIKMRDKSDYHHIAWQIKQQLVKTHPKDKAVAKASVRKWADQVRLIHKRDGYKLELICEVASWWLSDGGSKAMFWRFEAGTSGIRSTRGLRKNFDAMVTQMREAQRKAEFEAKKAK
jgi:hypothetical protein